MDVVDITLQRLGHVPSIQSNGQRLASWCDLREVFLWCPNPKCSVVLHALKCMLGFPDSELQMHACTQLEHLLFLKKFVVIPHGTLLVNIDCLQKAEVILVLNQMVKQKHAKSSDPNVKLCSRILTNIVEKYANTSFKVPLKTLSRKKILPSVRRIETETEMKLEDDCEDSRSGCTDSDTPSATDVLVPLSLLQDLVPHSASFLSEVVEMYVLGQCDQANLRTICKCDVVEGIQLTRFLAGQYRYDRPWQCVTSNSLLMSWGEFWSGYSHAHTFVQTATNMLDFSVVMLDCKVVSKGNPVQTVSNKKHMKEDEENDHPINKVPSLTNLDHMTVKLMHHVPKETPAIGQLEKDCNKQNCHKKLSVSEHGGGNTTSDDQAQLKIKEEPHVTETTENITDGMVFAMKQEPVQLEYEPTNADLRQKSKDFTKLDNIPNTDVSVTAVSQNTTNEKMKRRGRRPKCKDSNDFLITTQTNAHEATGFGQRRSSIDTEISSAKIEVRNIQTQNDNDVHCTKQSRRNERKTKAKIENKKSKLVDLEVETDSEIEKKNPNRSESESSSNTVNIDEDVTTYSFLRKLRPRVSKEEVRTTRYGRVLRSNSNNSAVPDVSERVENNKSSNARTKAKSAIERHNFKDTPTNESDANANIEKRMEDLCIEEKRQILDKVSIDARACSLTDARQKKKQQRASKSDTKQQNAGKNKIEVCITPKLLDVTEEVMITGECRGMVVMKQKKQLSSLANCSDRKTLKIGYAELNANIPEAFVTGAKSPMRRRSILIQSKSYNTTYEESKKTKEKAETTNLDENTELPTKQKYASIIPKKLELNLPAAMTLRKPSTGQPYSGGLVENSESVLKPETVINDSSKQTSTLTNIHTMDANEEIEVSNDQKVQSPIRSPVKSQSQYHSQNNLSISRQEPLTKTGGSSTQIGKLADEIVERLHQQASNAIRSVTGSSDSKVLEDISAQGRTFMCTRSENPSATDFMKERVSLWRKNLEEPKQRMAKPSEDNSYRLASDKRSMYTVPETVEQGSQSPSFKRALGAIISRSRPNSTEKSRGSHPTTIPSKEIKREPSLHLDVKGYGSSTSTTPDIYDEFARKKRPKGKTEIPKVKPKSVTKPLSPPLHLSITKKVPQTPPPPKKISTTPNYHTVGYTSAEVKGEQRQCVSALDGQVRQSYQHSEPCRSPNLPLNSQFFSMKPSFSHVGLAAAENLNSNRYTSTCPMCVHECNSNQLQAEKHSPEQCVKKSFVPEFSQFPKRRMIKSAPLMNSFSKDQCRSDMEEHDDEDICSSDSSETNVNSHFSNLALSEAENDNSEIDDPNQQGRKLTLLDKMTDFVEKYSLLKAMDDKEQEVDEHSNTEHLTQSDGHHTKSVTSMQDCPTPRTFMSRVKSQIYFTVPDDETYYPVTDNTIIPPQSEFYILTREGEYQKALPSTYSTKKGGHGVRQKKCAKANHELQGVKIDSLLKVSGYMVEKSKDTTAKNTDKIESLKVIEPSPHIILECKESKPQEGRNFRDAVEEKRAAKKKDDDEKSDLKFWSSANPDTNKTDETMQIQKQEKKKRRIVLEYLVHEDDQEEGLSKSNPDTKPSKERIRPKTSDGVSRCKPKQNIARSCKPRRPKTVGPRNQTRFDNCGITSKSRKEKLERELIDTNTAEPQIAPRSKSKKGRSKSKKISTGPGKEGAVGDGVQSLFDSFPEDISSDRIGLDSDQKRLKHFQNVCQGTKVFVPTSKRFEDERSEMMQQNEAVLVSGRDEDKEIAFDRNSNDEVIKTEAFNEVVVEPEVPQEDFYIDMAESAGHNEEDEISIKPDVYSTGGINGSYNHMGQTNPSDVKWILKIGNPGEQETDQLNETYMAGHISHTNNYTESSQLPQALSWYEQKKTFLTQESEAAVLKVSLFDEQDNSEANSKNEMRHWLDAVSCSEIETDMNSNSNSVQINNILNNKEVGDIDDQFDADHENQLGPAKSPNVVSECNKNPVDDVQVVGYLVDSASGVTVTVRQSDDCETFLTATYPDGDTYEIPKHLPHHRILEQLHQMLNESQTPIVDGLPSNFVPVADIDAFRRAIANRMSETHSYKPSNHTDNESELSTSNEEQDEQENTCDITAHNSASSRYSINTPMAASHDGCKSDTSQQELLDSETQMYLDQTSTLSVSRKKHRKQPQLLWPSTSEVRTFLKEGTETSRKVCQKSHTKAPEKPIPRPKPCSTQSKPRKEAVRQPNIKELDKLKQKLLKQCRGVSLDRSQGDSETHNDTSDEEDAHNGKKSMLKRICYNHSMTDDKDHVSEQKNSGTKCSDAVDTCKKVSEHNVSDEDEDYSYEEDDSEDNDDDDDDDDDNDDDEDYTPSEDEESETDSSGSEIDEALESNTSLKKHRVKTSQLEKIRKDFQKKYDVKKTCAAKKLKKLKMENQRKYKNLQDDSDDQKQTFKQRSNTKRESLVCQKSVFREYCLTRTATSSGEDVSDSESVEIGYESQRANRRRNQDKERSTHNKTQQSEPAKLKYTHATSQDLRKQKKVPNISETHKIFSQVDRKHEITDRVTQYLATKRRESKTKHKLMESSSNEGSIEEDTNKRNKSAANSFSGKERLTATKISNSKAKMSSSNSSRCNVKISASKDSRSKTKTSASDSSIRRKAKAKAKHGTGGDDSDEDDEGKKKDNTATAQGYIQTQMKIYEIIKNKSMSEKGPCDEDSECLSSSSLTLSISELPSGIPVRGDRPITKAIADAEKALEGTGGVPGSDDDSDDDTTVIQDYNTCCRYQLVEDEDKIQLGGVAYFSCYELPFVFINGYKFTPLKDVLGLFQPAYCVGQCTIPRKVLQQHKTLTKSFSTWDQVYKFDLIKMRQGPAITTGDMLLRLDTLISQLPELIVLVIRQHRNTTLKRSQHCDIRSYKQLCSNLASHDQLVQPI